MGGQMAPIETKTCEVCGNAYDKIFTVTTYEGLEHRFDSFECAIHALAPTCEYCKCRVIGHGVEADGHMYCCAHCAHAVGVSGVDDRADHQLDVSGRLPVG
jgi:hypothetical protein